MLQTVFHPVTSFRKNLRCRYYTPICPRTATPETRKKQRRPETALLLSARAAQYPERLDLPGKPVAFQVTDTFLRVFGLGSLADLPPLHGEAAESAEPEETEGDDGQLEWK